MGIRVNTNVQSISAQRNLGKTTEAAAASMSKMSSGSRISKAADDAAGLAISESMKATIRSTTQNVRNAQDGISMIQTAEGGMQEIGNILVRFRELSIQAASDTIGDTERGFIDKEVGQLRSEIERIATGTEFNGRKLLASEDVALEIQIGAKNVATQDRFIFDLNKAASTLKSLGMTEIHTRDKVSSQQNLEKIDAAISSLNGNRAEVGAMQNRLQSVVNNLNVYGENMAAANSRIRDVDVAAETSELTKQGILSQAGVAVLSQANTNAQLALKLL